jgi:hypothetical protein
MHGTLNVNIASVMSDGSKWSCLFLGTVWTPNY